MKTFRLIEIALLAIVLCLTSCSDDENPETPTPKEYTVSFGWAGEIVDITESPLTRATTNDLYGIQVYSSPSGAMSPNYTQYAYGLFDDTSLMTIKLIEGYMYKFIITMVVDGKNKIANGNNDYCAPFVTINGNTKLNNSFTYSTSEYLYSLQSGSIENTHHIFCLNADRYCGEVADYIPIENGTVTVDMKRTVFGAKFIAENLTVGVLNIKMEGTSDLTITYPNTQNEDIFSFPDCSLAYNNAEDYTTDFTVSFSWTKDDGVVIPLGTHNITFKRNKLTTITIKIVENSVNNGIGVNLESETMEDDKNLTIENGSVVETPVIP